MFLVRGGGLVTPPAEGAILPGVLRAKVEELETVRRGPYTGSFGWIAAHALDLNIVIRTLVRRGDRLFLQVGGGIVADSVPEREYRETLHKAAGMLRAVSAGIAERAG